MTDNLNQNDMTREELTKAIDEWAKENGASYILLGVERGNEEAFERYRGTEAELAALLGSAMIDGGDLGKATVKALRTITVLAGEALRRQNA